MAVATEEIVAFLRELTPFVSLSDEKLAHFAQKIASRHVTAGSVILAQGDIGHECFLLRRGKAEVVACDKMGNERHLGVLELGALFGEAALLSGARRNATVRATEPCELLVLAQEDFFDILHEDPVLRSHVIDLLCLRDRPKKVEGIEVQEKMSAEGDRFFVLHDPQRRLYFRLSPDGLFLWNRLDGDHTLKDLTIAYFETYKNFAPHLIADLLSSLGRAGFIAGRASGLAHFAARFLPWFSRAMRKLQYLLEWKMIRRDVDGCISRMYDSGVKLVFTWPAQVAMGTIAMVGLAQFFMVSQRVSLSLSAFWILIPAHLTGIFLHEAGHAFTTKAYGRKVLGLGLGWYWVTPIFFVDTSDMWLADRRARIAVSLAGPYAHLVLGGLASLMGSLMQAPSAAALLWVFALQCYAMVLFNLNPLLEYDGYYVLADLLDRPHLRRDIFSWFRRIF